MIKKVSLIIFCWVFMVTSLPGAAGQEPPKPQEAEKPEVAEKPKEVFGLAISPSVIRMTGKAGLTQQGTVRVFNNGIIPIRVETQTNDVGNRVDEQGNLQREFYPPGTLPFSCAKWVLLREVDLSLKPKDFQEVSFLVSPPEGTTGGAACVIFFGAVPEAGAEEAALGAGVPLQSQAAITIQPRLGLLLFYEIQGTVERAASLLELASEPPRQGQPLKIFYRFKNTGNSDVLISGTFYILDENKALVAKGDLQSIRTFPGDEGKGVTEWTGEIARGHYQLLLTFELGPEVQEVIVRELEFSVA